MVFVKESRFPENTMNNQLQFKLIEDQVARSAEPGFAVRNNCLTRR